MILSTELFEKDLPNLEFMQRVIVPLSLVQNLEMKHSLQKN